MIWNQGNQLGHAFSHSQKKQKHIYLVLKSNLCLCICLLEVRRFKCDTFAQLFLCIEIEVFEFLCMNLFGKYGFWHANQLQFLLLQCVCVCVCMYSSHRGFRSCEKGLSTIPSSRREGRDVERRVGGTRLSQLALGLPLSTGPPSTILPRDSRSLIASLSLSLSSFSLLVSPQIHLLEASMPALLQLF